MKLVTAIGHATTACGESAAQYEYLQQPALGQLFRDARAVLIENRELLDAAADLRDALQNINAEYNAGNADSFALASDMVRIARAALAKAGDA